MGSGEADWDAYEDEWWVAHDTRLSRLQRVLMCLEAYNEALYWHAVCENRARAIDTP